MNLEGIIRSSHRAGGCRRPDRAPAIRHVQIGSSAAPGKRREHYADHFRLKTGTISARIRFLRSVERGLVQRAWAWASM